MIWNYDIFKKKHIINKIYTLKNHRYSKTINKKFVIINAIIIIFNSML
jgi:hypothetical protein